MREQVFSPATGRAGWFSRLRAHPFVLGLLLALPVPLHAQFYARETERARVVYYDRSHEYIIPHLLRSFENSYGFHRRFFDYASREKITILLEDFDDYGYAGATAIPFNYLRLGIEPYKYVFETSPSNERFSWVVNHELLHIVASDKPAGSDRFFRGLFAGKVSPVGEQPLSMVYSFMTNPRKYSPRWYHEGGAVFMETWMSGGIGRTLGGYDEMVFRAKVRDTSYLYDIVGLESEGTTIDFQVGANSYLYGTRFMSYLAVQYGPEKMVAWINRTEGSDAYFANQFEEVYGTPLDDAWEEWIAFERHWQHASLDSIRRFPVTPYREISRQTLGSVSQAFYDSARAKIIVAVNYPGQFAHIAAIDVRTGEVEKICDVYGAALYYVTSLAYDPATGTAFYTTNNSRDWRHLYAVQLEEKSPRRLLTYLRAGDLAFDASDRSLWGVRHHAGFSSVIWVPSPYENWYELVTLDYGKDLFDLDVSPDGRHLAGSFINIRGDQTLIQLETDSLKKGRFLPAELLRFENNTSPETFVYSRDGRSLFGTSYYSGVSNVFRYDRATRTFDAVSNAETGFFRPVPLSADSLIVFRATGEGFLPVQIGTVSQDVNAIALLGQQIVERHPVVTKWTVGSPRAVNIDSLTTYNGDYHGLSRLGMQSVYPIVEGYKVYAGVGARVNLSDPLQLHALDLTGSYSPYSGLPPDERLHVAANYSYMQWKISASYNLADFYDLFGPKKSSFKGYALSVVYSDFLFNERPKRLEYTISVAGYAGLQRLPDFQNVRASFGENLTIRARMDYSDLRRSLGAVEYEAGWIARAASVNNVIPGAFIPVLYANLDWGILLPIHHSSLWLRSSAGHSFGERDEPFANFYFGGFRNNYVDHQDEHRYREFLSFPGVTIDGIGATNYLKLTAEWTLPPIRFRRLGLPNFYCTWARLALFSQALVSDPLKEQYERVFGSLGAQLDFRLTVFARLDMTLSFGYAVATERSARLSNEFMASLKIL
jgi:hypothetical protein